MVFMAFFKKIILNKMTCDYVTDKFGIKTLYELSNSIAPTAEWKLKAWSRFLSKFFFPIFNIYNASDNVVQTQTVFVPVKLTETYDVTQIWQTVHLAITIKMGVYHI